MLINKMPYLTEIIQIIAVPAFGTHFILIFFIYIYIIEKPKSIYPRRGRNHNY